MMYNKKLVAIIKIGNKILREYNDNVYIPFGSEYKIGLKNLESRKVAIKIMIDGDEVLGNNSIILSPNEEIDIERFITNNNFNSGNKFKFIKKTQEISNHRGDRIDDGIVKIEFRFEKESMPITISGEYTVWMDKSPDYHQSIFRKKGIYDITSNSNAYYSSVISSSLNLEKTIIDNNDGITAKGSISNQGFQYGQINELESTVHTIVFKLNGINDKNIKIQKSITVTERIQCENCGRIWKSSNKFCPNCGTSLI